MFDLWISSGDLKFTFSTFLILTFGIIELKFLSSSPIPEHNSGASRWTQSEGRVIEYLLLSGSIWGLPTPVKAAKVERPRPFITA